MFQMKVLAVGGFCLELLSLTPGCHLLLVSLHEFLSVLVCVIISSHKDPSHTRLRPTLMTSYNPITFLKGPISK